MRFVLIFLILLLGQTGHARCFVYPYTPDFKRILYQAGRHNFVVPHPTTRAFYAHKRKILGSNVHVLAIEATHNDNALTIKGTFHPTHGHYLQRFSPIETGLLSKWKQSPGWKQAHEQGHGNMISSLIVGQGRKAPVGIAPAADLSIIPFYSFWVKPKMKSILTQAFEEAARSRPDIVNLSITKKSPLTIEEQQAFQTLLKTGTIIVQAAGNNHCPFEALPYTHSLIEHAGERKNQLIFALSSTINAHYFETLSPYSNWSHSIGIPYSLTAPGTNIITSNAKDNLVIGCGTSYSAPIISGALALLISHFKHTYKLHKTPDQYVSLLMRSARQFSWNERKSKQATTRLKGFNTRLGQGFLNIKGAILLGEYEWLGKKPSPKQILRHLYRANPKLAKIAQPSLPKTRANSQISKNKTRKRVQQTKKRPTKPTVSYRKPTKRNHLQGRTMFLKRAMKKKLLHPRAIRPKLRRAIRDRKTY